jgi:hypothetical protein
VGVRLRALGYDIGITNLCHGIMTREGYDSFGLEYMLNEDILLLNGVQADNAYSVPFGKPQSCALAVLRRHATERVRAPLDCIVVEQQPRKSGKMDGLGTTVAAFWKEWQVEHPLGRDGRPCPVFFQHGTTKLRLFVEPPTNIGDDQVRGASAKPRQEADCDRGCRCCC